MKVILEKEFENLGQIGDIVKVSDGYARNFLIPKGIAIKAAEKNLAELEHQKRVMQAKVQKQIKEAKDLADKFNEYSCSINKKVGENEKIYGSVTSADIEEALKKDGYNISRKDIIIEEPIKALGVYTVTVKISKGIDAKLKVWVVEE